MPNNFHILNIITKTNKLQLLLNLKLLYERDSQDLLTGWVFMDQRDIYAMKLQELHVSGSYSQKLKLMSKELADYKKKFFLNQKKSWTSART